MSLAAIALMALGVLRGFDIIGTEVTNDEGGQTAGNILDAIVWFLPGMTAAFLAFSFHRRDAHRIEDAAAKGERTISWLMAAVATAAGVLALLVGFDVLGGDYNQYDGMIWGMASIIPGVLSTAWQAVRHHAAEEDYVVRLVEERVRMGATTTTPAMSGTTTETGRRVVR
jgi:hypothetical protein